MSKTIFTNDDVTLSMGGELFQGASQVAQEACDALKRAGKGTSEILHALMNMGAGYINVVAALIARHDLSKFTEDSMDDFNPNFAITPDVLLFSAILMNVAAPTCGEDGSVDVQFGPHVISRALKTFEQFTGRPADGSLDQSFVQAGREFDESQMPQLLAEAAMRDAGINRGRLN